MAPPRPKKRQRRQPRKGHGVVEERCHADRQVRNRRKIEQHRGSAIGAPKEEPDLVVAAEADPGRRDPAGQNADAKRTKATSGPGNPRAARLATTAIAANRMAAVTSSNGAGGTGPFRGRDEGRSVKRAKFASRRGSCQMVSHESQGRRPQGHARKPSSKTSSGSARSRACPRRSARGATTILKDNISWHYPFPGANTTPWQLEGTILALKKAGYSDVTCVQNKTVVTNAFKGEDLNHYVPLFKKYDIPVLYNFKESDMRWVEYRPKAQDARAAQDLPRGHPAFPTTSSARTSSTCRRSSATSTRRPPAR